MKPLREELTRIDAAISGDSEGLWEEHPGLELSQSELHRRRSEFLESAAGVLLMDLEEEDEGTESGLSLSGLSKMLESLQAGLDRTAQAILGSPDRTGQVPGEIREMVALRLVDAVPGSLHLKMVPAQRDLEAHLNQGVLEEVEAIDGTEVSLLDDAMSHFLNLLSPEPDDQARLQQVAYVGSYAANHAKDVAKFISRNSLVTDFEWSSAFQMRETALSSADASLLVDFLNQTSEETQEIVVKGLLIGLSAHRGIFDIEPVDGGEVMSGRVDSETARLIEPYFKRSCAVKILVRSASTVGGARSEVYQLTGLASGKTDEISD